MEARKREHYTTREFAGRIGRGTAIIYKSLRNEGHYLGVKPVTLPNGRYLWPMKAVDALLPKGDES
jgi:hypothetical protein